MKIVIMASVAGALLAGLVDVASAAGHSSLARQPRPSDYSALSLRAHSPRDNLPFDNALHGNTNDTSSTATGGPSGGLF